MPEDNLFFCSYFSSKIYKKNTKILEYYLIIDYIYILQGGIICGTCQSERQTKMQAA
jgi:hypothetical protein